jgi:Chaperone of endosialidase
MMKPLIELRQTTPLVATVLLLLACIGTPSVPNVFGVVPPPDGGYPGFNTAEGDKALFNLTTGVGNAAVGWYSLFSNTDGSYNTAVGAGTLVFNIGDPSAGDGIQNTAIGTAALLFNTTGSSNTAVGLSALSSNAVGDFNTAVGAGALRNSRSFSNTAVGSAALELSIGTNNTAIGVNALHSNTLGNDNTALGINAGQGVTTASNVICIRASGANVDNSCFIANIYSNVQPIVGTNPDSVTITSLGRLGRGNVSSRRYKHDIKPMEKASEAIYALKPVSFRYNKEYDATQTLAFGLIAEEVAEVYPDLVGRNPQGQAESVRYEQINAMLLNEFLKEHRKNEEQAATIDRLVAADTRQQKQIETLTAALEKVNVQIELNKSRTQTVSNNP